MRLNKRKTFGFWGIIFGIFVVISLACSGPADLFWSFVGEEGDFDPDLVYPHAEFLFEVIPFGYVLHENDQHVIRWRIYTTDIRIDAVGDYYAEAIPGWQVKKDELLNGYRYIVLSGTHALSSIMDKAGFTSVIQQNQELVRGMLDVEVLNSTAHSGEGRLSMILEQGIFPEPLPDGTRISIPGDTTLIIIADYFKQEIDSTATPEPTATLAQDQDLPPACQAAIESGLCANPYSPPIEGLTLIYQIDGGCDLPMTV
jgi:hypothetical protein